MNIKDVAKREVLDFKAFRGKVHDETFKPLDPKNQVDSSDKTGLHKIKREPAYDFAGYADAVFGGKSGIEIPGYNEKGNREYTINNAAPSIVNQPNSTITEGMEFEGIPTIKKLTEFDGGGLGEVKLPIPTENETSESEKIEEGFITKLSEYK